jgi:hypothetical protein
MPALLLLLPLLLMMTGVLRDLEARHAPGLRC